jgi:23S rRNA (adenine2030-N6)-methyltransferase
MLSYQHVYHAGNFADVHKHVALILLLRALSRKPAPFMMLDTHAGRGDYDLDSAEALGTGEFRDGIARLWDRPPAYDAVADYLTQVRNCNPDGRLRRYPGSPRLARMLLRKRDRLLLCELHPAEHAALRAALGGDNRVAIHRRDGFEALGALLPPAERRGLVLIDPSYELKTEYRQVAATVATTHKRWPTGAYLIWYPLLAAGRYRQLLNALADSGIRGILRSELQVRRPAGGGRRGGLYGSGLLLINPPWRIDTALGETASWLAGILSKDTHQANTDWLVPE